MCLSAASRAESGSEAQARRGAGRQRQCLPVTVPRSLPTLARVIFKQPPGPLAGYPVVACPAALCTALPACRPAGSRGQSLAGRPRPAGVCHVHHDGTATVALTGHWKSLSSFTTWKCYRGRILWLSIALARCDAGASFQVAQINYLFLVLARPVLSCRGLLVHPISHGPVSRQAQAPRVTHAAWRIVHPDGERTR